MRKLTGQMSVAVMLISILAGGCAMERSSWQPSQPQKRDFENIVREKWEQEYEKVNRWDSGKWNYDVRTRCVAVPSYPAPDQSSKSRLPFAWHIDFIEGGPVKEDRTRQLKQLDALVKAGMLQRDSIEIEKGGVKVKGARYGLTVAGWKVASTNQAPFCFVYGVPRFLGVTDISPGLVNVQSGIEIYTVIAKVGLEKHDLAEWARNEDVREAFPDMKRLIEGEERKHQFIRGAKGWIPYECLQTIIMRKEYIQMCESAPQGNGTNRSAATHADSEMHDLLAERDKSIAQFEKTFPAMLEKKPVGEREKLKEEVRQNLSTLKNASPPTEEEVRNLIRNEYEIGGATVEFVGLKRYFNGGYRFKYRVILSYKVMPGRELDPSILAYRNDLRAMIEHGKACSGDFGFDVKSRGRQGGNGGCWNVADDEIVVAGPRSTHPGEQRTDRAPQSVLKGCRFDGVVIPQNARVYAVDGNKGKRLDSQIDQSGHQARQVDVTVNSQGNPSVLILVAYEPTIWDVHWTAGTKILAVLASGYHHQAVAGLPKSVPVLVSTYDNKGVCGYVHVSGPDGRDVNSLSKRLLGRHVDAVTAANGGTATAGEAILPNSERKTSSDTPPESYVDKNAPLAGPAGVLDAVAKGILRHATDADGKAWEHAVLEKTPNAKVRVYSFRAYVVLKEFIYPAGLYGGDSAVFFVPKGVSAPIGDPGHSTIYDFNTLRCHGPGCRR